MFNSKRKIPIKNKCLFEKGGMPAYKKFPNILHSLNAKSNMILSWTHYKILLQIEDSKARDWYEKEAIEQTWSTRTLQRNIDTQYYYRLLKSQVKEPVINEMKEKNKEHYLINKLEFVKNPVIAELLGCFRGHLPKTGRCLFCLFLSTFQKQRNLFYCFWSCFRKVSPKT